MLLVGLIDHVPWSIWLCLMAPVGTLLAPLALWCVDRFRLPVVVGAEESAIFYAQGFLAATLYLLEMLFTVLAIQVNHEARTIGIWGSITFGYTRRRPFVYLTVHS